MKKAFPYYLPALPIYSSTAGATLAKGTAGPALVTRLVKALRETSQVDEPWYEKGKR